MLDRSIWQLKLITQRVMPIVVESVTASVLVMAVVIILSVCGPASAAARERVTAAKKSPRLLPEKCTRSFSTPVIVSSEVGGDALQRGICAVASKLQELPRDVTITRILSSLIRL